MKKVLSIVLALMLMLGAIACTTQQPATATATDAPKAEPTVTEAPKAQEPEPEPEPEPAAEPQYEALGLTIKNKSGKTVDELYIYPTGGDKGVSVVQKGWPTKKADGEKFEQNIYIVRPADTEMTALAVFEDGSTTSLDLGKIEMYGEVKLEETGFEYEVEDDPEDQAAIALVVATGKTADNQYPGYVKVAAEMKNKTGKNITELYFYEEGGDPKAYNNLIDYLYNAAGEKFESWTPGKAKEGGRYVFSFFLRPESQNYCIDLYFDDGTSLIGALIDDWFKPTGDGNYKNEISMKDAEDDTAWKIEWDDGTDDDYQMPMDERLAYEMNVVGVTADGWFPTYPGAPEVDPAAAEEALVELVKAAVPFAGEKAEEPADEPAEPAAAAGDTIGVNIKNKTGVTIDEVYIYVKGSEDKGASLVEKGWKDKDADKANYEKNVLVIRPEGAEMEMFVVFEGGETATWDTIGQLAMYDKLSLKKGTDVTQWEHEPEDDPEVLAAIDALVAAAAAAPAGGDKIGVNIKNKTGVTIDEVYIYVKGSEDKGASLVEKGWKDKDADKANYEKNVLVIRPEGAEMEMFVVFEGGETATWELGQLSMYDKLSLKKGTDVTQWEHEPEDDAEVIAAIDALVLGA